MRSQGVKSIHSEFSKQSRLNPHIQTVSITSASVADLSFSHVTHVLLQLEVMLPGLHKFHVRHLKHDVKNMENNFCSFL
jgi:hypothetical protein